MSVPDFQSIMLPLLKLTGDDKEHSTQELVKNLTEHFSLSEQEQNEMLPSGKQTRIYNRVTWARIYLSKSGLLEMTRRSFYRITERGKQVLKSNPSQINMKYLEQFPEYINFREKEGNRKPPGQPGGGKPGPIRTPEEALEAAYQEISETLAHDLLELVKKSTPAFFERLVVELLVKMGYGGSRREAARVLGQSGDEGIDGIIDEDKLGLDAVYIQAKKWKDPVSRPEIQKFVGALSGKHIKKGIFITTSSFTDEAKNYILGIDFRIVLVDGKKLAEYMIDYDVGVIGDTCYQLKRIDTEYFPVEG